MDKDIYYKPVQIDKKIVSGFETCYHKEKQNIINHILKKLEEESILKIKDNNK